jgi:membrane-associated phospholipid phosphatase
VLDQLLLLDRELAGEVEDVRWAPLTAVFILLSAWWVKSLVFVAAGAVDDVRRRALRAAPVIAIAFGLSSLASTLVKGLIDRPRPTFDPLIDLPASASFPSGHATTAFAAAVACAVLLPRLRVPALVLATLVAVSRVYLGVHYLVDVVAGALLGGAIGLAVAWPFRPPPSAPAERSRTRPPWRRRPSPRRTAAPPAARPPTSPG